MHLIAGLGNPGIRYKNTRHNIGFDVVSSFARKVGVRLTGRRFNSRNCLARVDGKEIILIRPMTLMNLSGISVRECADSYGIEPENILVIHDDLDLPIGRIKVISRGGAGGHRGVKSISDNLGNSNFPRIKVGIGRPMRRETVEDYVLSPFYREQKKDINKIIDISIHACFFFISKGIDSAMNHINSKNEELKEGNKQCSK